MKDITKKQELVTDQVGSSHQIGQKLCGPQDSLSTYLHLNSAGLWPAQQDDGGSSELGLC